MKQYLSKSSTKTVREGNSRKIMRLKKEISENQRKSVGDAAEQVGESSQNMN